MKHIRAIAAAVIVTCIGLGVAAHVAHGQSVASDAPDRAAQSLLRLSLELASETPPEEAQALDREVGLLYEEIASAQKQRRLIRDFLDVLPDQQYTAVVAAEGTSAIHYLQAMRRSLARFKGARDADHHDWISKHLTAAQRYAVFAAEALVAEAKIVEDRAATLQTKQFAVRRSREEAAAVLEEIKRNGLSAAHREILRESGWVDQAIDVIELMVRVSSPGSELGISVVEAYTKIAKQRHGLAGSLGEFIQDPVPESGVLSHTFVVGNPTDREATVDLYIRPASISPQWMLSIVDAAEAASDGENADAMVQEVAEGEHYRVRLRAGEQTPVASVLKPVGPVGPNTTARWAVEGKIGGELIGGMMHEMHVPAVLDNLQLPAISPATAPATLETVSSFPRLVWILGVVLLVIAVAAVIFTRRALRGTEPESN